MGLKAAWNGLWNRPEQATPIRPAAPEPDAPLIGVPDLADLTAAVNAHHAEIAQLRLEWAETIDKFTAWANRQAARDRVRMKRSMSEMESNEEEQGSLALPHGSQPMPAGAGMEGIPAVPNGTRHPKADLYARIRRQ